ncbi:hypothetical protein J2S28_004578 [Rhizobium sp. SLBN-94]|nr:hypothetical protein ATCR1_14731 [Agrobacterium tumefaciens CCNWGS0286]MCP2137475.1 hypothetical protein [Rhizobium sp. SLBN-94]
MFPEVSRKVGRDVHFPVFLDLGKLMRQLTCGFLFYICSAYGKHYPSRTNRLISAGRDDRHGDDQLCFVEV